MTPSLEEKGWDGRAVSEVQTKVGSDHDVKGEMGGTDRTEQQRCQRILRQQVRQGSTQPAAPGCRKHTAETKEEQTWQEERRPLLIFDVVIILRTVETVHGGPEIEQHSC